MTRWLQSALALLALSLAGCAAYQLGRPEPTLPASVHLAPVINRSEAPQVRALLTDALRETFLRAGGWHLQTAENARVHIQVTLLNFERDFAATSSRDTGRAVSFENRLVAEVTAVDAGTGEPLMEPIRVQAEGMALADPSLVDSESQALPALAGQLAQRIQDRLAGGSWQ